MKLRTLEAVKIILADRTVAILLGAFLLLVIAFCISVAVSLRPNELQVVTHYTAFGITNFYRDKWYYFLSFIAFGGIVGAVHACVVAKLYQEKDRSFAIGFAWLGIVTVLIAWVLTHSILQVASLS
ncbi:hypothetical protein D9M68_766200 [compost metagenome]